MPRPALLHAGGRAAHKARTMPGRKRLDQGARRAGVPARSAFHIPAARHRIDRDGARPTAVFGRARSAESGIRGARAMANWMRFERGGRIEFGTVKDGVIAVHTGDMFGANKPTGESVKLADVRVATPCDPSQDGLPVEQLPPARRQEQFPRARRAALLPQGAQRLSPARRADRAAEILQRPDPLRRRARRRHRQEMRRTSPRPRRRTTSSATPA